MYLTLNDFFWTCHPERACMSSRAQRRIWRERSKRESVSSLTNQGGSGRRSRPDCPLFHSGQILRCALDDRVARYITTYGAAPTVAWRGGGIVTTVGARGGGWLGGGLVLAHA